jgi:hypothetical protein
MTHITLLITRHIISSERVPPVGNTRQGIDWIQRFMAAAASLASDRVVRPSSFKSRAETLKLAAFASDRVVLPSLFLSATYRFGVRAGLFLAVGVFLAEGGGLLLARAGLLPARRLDARVATVSCGVDDFFDSFSARRDSTTTAAAATEPNSIADDGHAAAGTGVAGEEKNWASWMRLARHSMGAHGVVDGGK